MLRTVGNLGEIVLITFKIGAHEAGNPHVLLITVTIALAMSSASCLSFFFPLQVLFLELITFLFFF